MQIHTPKPPRDSVLRAGGPASGRHHMDSKASLSLSIPTEEASESTGHHLQSHALLMTHGTPQSECRKWKSKSSPLWMGNAPPPPASIHHLFLQLLLIAPCTEGSQPWSPFLSTGQSPNQPTASPPKECLPLPFPHIPCTWPSDWHFVDTH